MKHNIFCKAIVFTCLAILYTSYVSAVTVTATDVVNNWTKGISPLGTNTSSWTTSGSSVYYSSNSGSTAWSNFTLSGDFVFKVQIMGNSDNDRYGILFGNDASNNYRISWEAGGLADTSYRGLQFLSESGDAVTALANYNAYYWTSGVTYEMTIYRIGDIIGFRVARVSDGVELQHYYTTNTTFTSGKIGLWNQSQVTYYSNIEYFSSNPA